MGTIVSLIIGVILVSGFALFAFYRSRSVLRYAKGIERRLKMVPMLIHLPPLSEDTEIGSRDVRDVIEEKISQAESLYNVLSSTGKKGFWSKFYGQRHIAFEIVATKGEVNYYVVVPVVLQQVVQQAILSAYPTARLEEVAEHNLFNPVGKLSATVGGEMHLKKDFAYPIATFRESRRDVMQTILNAFNALADEDGAAIQILIRPANENWQKSAQSVAAQKKKKKGEKGGVGALTSSREIFSALWKPPEVQDTKPEDKQLSNMEQAMVDAIEQKTRSVGYESMIRLIVSSNVNDRAQSLLNNLVAAFALFDSPSSNGFSFTPAKDMRSFATAFIFRFFPPELNKDVLNTTELATIFHFPDQRFTPTAQLQRQESKEVDGPRNLPQAGLLLGHNQFRGVKKEVRLSEEDRRRHTYIVGQTGTGKSQLLENLALQDMISGNGFAFIDPHGDAVENLLTMVPKERTEDVIYFNPGDMEYPLGLNLFEFETPEQKDFLIQEAINMLYKLYDPQRQGIIGPRYEHLFRNAALTIMSDPGGGSFVDIPKLFNDRAYVNQKLKHVTDPSVIDFWQREMPDSQRSTEFGEVKSWFVSKFGAFLSNTMMRNIIGQTKSAFNLRDIMDDRKILLVNLSKGRTGELNSKLLGMIFVMKFQAAAMSRASLAEAQRADFCLYVDEFQNFSTESFATILAESRKYHLNLIVANQYIGQLTEDVRDAVFGNVGTIVSFRSGATDAEFLAKQFMPIFDMADLIKLPNFHTVVRLMIGGVPSQPFSLKTLPRLGVMNQQLAAALKQLSAAKFGKPRLEVEKSILKRLETPKQALGASTTTSRPSSPLSRPSTYTPPAANRSFLDEWLAKRQANQPTSRSPAANNSHSFLGTNAGDTTPSPSMPSSTEETVAETQQSKPSVYQHHTRLEPLTGNATGGNASDQDNRAIDNLQSATPSALESHATLAPQPDLVSIDNVADILKHKLNAQMTEPKPQPSNQDKLVQKVPRAQLPQQPSPESLHPGEIYIDETGRVYQAKTDKEEG